MVASLYVGSGSAVKSTWRGSNNTVDIEHMSFQYVGDSDDEAYGWAMRKLQELLPIHRGYAHHHAAMHRLERSQIQEWLDATLAQEGGSDGD